MPTNTLDKCRDCGCVYLFSWGPCIECGKEPLCAECAYEVDSILDRVCLDCYRKRKADQEQLELALDGHGQDDDPPGWTGGGVW